MKKGIEKYREDAGFDVIGIGSALLDLIVSIDDSVLAEIGLTKGRMYLIDEKRSRDIISILKHLELQVEPGGSAANTIAGLCRLGGRGMFLGRVGKDSHGDIYVKETEKSGVVAHIGRDGSLTGHAITLITPDSERTFATHLGAALTFTRNDVYEQGIADSKILHLEGYLFEPPNLREACYFAMQCARRHGALISIDLSDPNLIGRIHEVFVEVIRDYANIVFVNEDEAEAFTGRKAEDALGTIAAQCDLAAVKLGSKGSLIQVGDAVYEIPSFKTSVVNTNGAGDMYAAGVLYGISRGDAPFLCGKYGSYAASLVVSQTGARYPKPVPVDKIR